MKRLLLCLALLVATACTHDTADKTITVFGASSLQRAFTAEGKAFEAAHPGVHVLFSFAGSQALVAQIEQGAPADVLATADLETIGKVRAKLTADPVVFAHNQLAIVTAAGNPRGLHTLQDLTTVRLVVAGPTVPLGKATAKALAAAGVKVKPLSQEDSASGVVTKVRLGEADAGIAYASDLGSVGGVRLAGTTTSLAIGLLNDGSEAAAFLTYVRSGAGQRILLDAGFT
ncbi:MAG: molybdate transporter substrate-binding protein [Frankiales bacterium]|nr:molybdate transporter substrate-binding protein [Frankiales bacterium]